MLHSRRNDRVMAASRTLDGHVEPGHHGIWHVTPAPSMDLVTHEACRALNPCDASITIDQNWPKQIFFHKVDNREFIW